MLGRPCARATPGRRLGRADADVLRADVGARGAGGGEQVGERRGRVGERAGGVERGEARPDEARRAQRVEPGRLHEQRLVAGDRPLGLDERGAALGHDGVLRDKVAAGADAAFDEAQHLLALRERGRELPLLHPDELAVQQQLQKALRDVERDLLLGPDGGDARRGAVQPRAFDGVARAPAVEEAQVGGDAGRERLRGL